MLFVCFKMRFEYLINKLPALSHTQKKTCACNWFIVALIFTTILCQSFMAMLTHAPNMYSKHTIFVYCIEQARRGFRPLRLCVNRIWVKIQSHAGVVISILAALTFAKLSDIACETWTLQLSTCHTNSLVSHANSGDSTSKKLLFWSLTLRFPVKFKQIIRSIVRFNVSINRKPQI